MPDQLRIVGFEWSGTLRIYEVGAFSFQPEENRTEFELWDGYQDNHFNWIHLQFNLTVGYLYQQLNEFANYVLPNASVINSATAAKATDILNALRNSRQSNPVYFYPAILIDETVDTATKYAVASDMRQFELLRAERAGFFKNPVPIRFKTLVPLNQYPTWANR